MNYMKPKNVVPRGPPLVRPPQHSPREKPASLFSRILEHFIGDENVPLLSAEDFRELYGTTTIH